jgi:hypothetical protein
MMTTRHYSASEHTVNFAGIDLFSGAGPDEFLTTEEPEDAFNMVAGVDGEVTVNAMQSPIMNAAVTLQATSSVNDKLSALHEAHRKSVANGGVGVAPFYYKNRQGTDLLFSGEAVITKRPARSKGKSVGTVTWNFQLAQAENFSGS